MKSVVTVDIDAPQLQVASLYADPSSAVCWMDDLERCEPVSGIPGDEESVYRLVPKQGSRVVTATVVTRDLPEELRLSLTASGVTVDVHATLSSLHPGGTRLVSEEAFAFQGFWRSMLGLLAMPAIHAAHRRHIEAFKSFAERELRAPGRVRPADRPPPAPELRLD